jgi:hypothetical protein
MSLYRVGAAVGAAGALGAAHLGTNFIGGFICMFEKCSSPMFKCFTESVCRSTLSCILQSDFSQPGSQLNCEVENAERGSVEDFTVLTECLYNPKNACRKVEKDDMTCRVNTTSG